MIAYEPDLDDFSGVLSVRRGGMVLGEWATGVADRSSGTPNTPDTRFALASGSKTFTALTILSLIDDGALRLDTTARSVLGDDLPLIADGVTIDHLLTHTSGIGDYLDEDVDALAPMTVPVQQLESTPAFLRVLDGFPMKFRAGERFSYSNGGYVVLALIAERIGRAPFAELVGHRVFVRAGMTSSGYPRSDHLPPHTAYGYKPDGRTNVFELPVVGSGDGGAYSTVSDLHRFWLALFDGRIVSRAAVASAVEPVTPDGGNGVGYGRGIQIDGDVMMLSGADHGVSAMSLHHPTSKTTATALANIETRLMVRTRAAMNAARRAS